MIKEYLTKVANTTTLGDAREESYYGHLSVLLNEFAASIGKTKIQITTLPKKTEAGNPDFRVWDGKEHIVGYIEAKNPDANLDVEENKEQLRGRYRKTFPNLILTNFYEFRLYREGELIDKVQIARSFIAKKLQTIPPVENEEKFLSFLTKFFSFLLPKVYTAEQLAIELAKRTRFLRDEVIPVEMEQQQKGVGELYGFYQAFRKFLIADLKENDFADLFSQTITYGLFAARTKSINGFNRKLAYDLIPKTIGILRNVFKFISQGDLPKEMEWIIDDISEVLNIADVKNILQQYYKAGKGEDPVVHFYETFLNIYNPQTREKRGVYYTPEPVVRCIVHSVHELLKTHFELPDGLASKEVTLLDPAGGTLTFPAEAIKVAVNEYTGKYGDGGLNSFISNHILKNFFAFELMMAPYTIGHIKINFLLEDLGYLMKEDERFKLYLTNTLDMEDLSRTPIPGLESLSQESHAAGKVKKEESILVIIGNPPYSGISSNPSELIKWTTKKSFIKKMVVGPDGKPQLGKDNKPVYITYETTKEVKVIEKTFIGNLIETYKQVDGKPLEERKLWLQDDYVKFLRFAQWKIEKAGKGIVGMITNHGYLDNPTFRGMRQSLMNTFNTIYINDLHGNALKKETAPDGSKDENVFDIRQGVSIVLLIKEKNKKGCKVSHMDLFGLRAQKYHLLDTTDFKPRSYNTLKPASPWYFFIPRDTAGIENYNKWPKLNEIFPVNVTGIVTARDEFVIDINEHQLRNRIIQFRNLKQPDDIIREVYKLKDTRGWKLSEARKNLAMDENWDKYFRKILYRPFDIRYIYYSAKMVDWGRPEFMKHLLKIEKNIGLCFVRQYSGNTPYNHALISELIIDNRTFFSSKGIIQIAPLFVIPDNGKNSNGDLFNPANREPVPNIAEKILTTLMEKYSKRLKPRQILNYIYAILYSNNYREKYAAFLKIDFPRIPFTKDYLLFRKLEKLGNELIHLHLLKHSVLNYPVSKFKGKGDDLKISRPDYHETEKRIYINDDKYFENVSTEIWKYCIGGYPVLDKFLKERKGLPMVDSEHYCKMITSIAETIKIQKQIAGTFSNAEKQVISF